MNTQPQLYEGQLSAEAAEHREFLEARLNGLYEELENLAGIKRLKLLKEINELEQTLDWQGANPKHVDFTEIKEHVQSPRGDSDIIEKKYRARIKNRATAIRGYCVECQGGFIAGVKDCVAVTCPLFPFRMGKDPFRGWELPKPFIEPEMPEDEEDVGEFEDGDEGDVDD